MATNKPPTSFRVLAEHLSGVTNIWLEGPLTDEKWTVAYRIVLLGGRPRVGELRIFPSEAERRRTGEWSAAEKGVHATAPRNGLTNKVIRSAKAHLWLEYAQQIIRTAKKKADPLGPVPIPADGDALPANVEWGAPETELELFTRSALLSKRQRQRGSGRKRLAADFYAEIAKEYEAATPKGNGAAGSKRKVRPVQQIATTHSVSPAVARGWIHRARKYGFLSESTQGAIGGKLTPKGFKELISASKGHRRSAEGKQRRRRR